jgi:catechol 2,3-dioxygenase-like lactoylglutathione lyase family enzyme
MTEPGIQNRHGPQQFPEFLEWRHPIEDPPADSASRSHPFYAASMATSRHDGFDHVTIAVPDLEGAIGFFALLGFEQTNATVVSGDEMSEYMGIPDWEADHVTLTLTGATTHQEVQLLCFHRPDVPGNPEEPNLARMGFNHVCFAVDDLDATLTRLKAAGVRTRNEVMSFHDRRLVFVVGPADVTIELAEWASPGGGGRPAEEG